MAISMSQSEEPILSDKTVSRMMAERAVQDQGFKDLLSNFVRSVGDERSRPKNFNTILTIISEYREKIADRMELRAPHALVGGGPQKLNTYLKQTTNSRILVSNIATQEEKRNEAASEQMEYKWGWVVSHQVCAKVLTKLTLDLGTADVHCTLGFWILAVHAPFSSRPFTFLL